MAKHWRVAAAFKMHIGVQPPLSFSWLNAALSLILSVHFLMFGEMCLDHSKVARTHALPHMLMVL